MRSVRSYSAIACVSLALVASAVLPGRLLPVSAGSADCDDAPPPGAVPTPGGPCELVYGQLGSFTTGSQNKGGVSARSLYFPNKIAVDRNGSLYAADMFNSRILMYPIGSTSANRVWGQGPQGNRLSSNATNCGGAVSASCFNLAASVAVDSHGDVYAGDWYNGRVLYFPAGSYAATRVYGASNLVSVGSQTADPQGIQGPADLALDPSGNLWVVDQYHSRVLEFAAGCTGSPCSAVRVIGQSSFTASTAPNPPNSVSLAEPTGLAFDSGGGLYVMDTDNNRVLFYGDANACPQFACAATKVYGQPGFTTGTAGTSATTLRSPGAAVVDSVGGLYVSDGGNSRVLYFAPSCTGSPCSATRVYGHNGSFICGVADDNGACAAGGPSAVNLSGASQVSLDRFGNLYVVDPPNSRILRYSPR